METQLRCSFCGKTQKEVKKLIAGPSVFICDECVFLCMEIIFDQDDGDYEIVRKCSGSSWKLAILVKKDDGTCMIHFGGEKHFVLDFSNELNTMDKLATHLKEVFKDLSSHADSLEALSRRKEKLETLLSDHDRILSELGEVNERIDALRRKDKS